MRFVPLASSSAGNAYIVEEPGGGKLLLECGLTYKRLTRLAGYRLSGLCGCLITHEHKDHSGCWKDLIKNGVQVWASAGTIERLTEGGGTSASLLEELPEVADGDNPHPPSAGAPLPKGPEGRLSGRYIPFSVGPFEVLPFPTFHDAKQPVGYLIRNRGEKLAFMTDTVAIHSRFPGVNILAVEANYDKDILARCERMPDKVKQRVQNSHMEIGTLCRYLQGADLSACRELYLLHLSDASANEGDALRRVREAVPPGIRVTACPKIGGG